MIGGLSIAVFTLDETVYGKLKDSLSELADRVAQFNYRDRLESLLTFAGEGSLIVLFDTSRERETCLRWIKRLSGVRSNTIAVCLEKEASDSDMLDSVRAGARDFLVGDFTAEESRAMVKRLAGLFQRPRFTSTVIGVMGAAGGCGVSTLVANLAVEIAKSQNVSVGILGLNPYSNGPEMLLNMRPSNSLFDLWENADSLDTSSVASSMSKHPSGVALISAQGWPLADLPIPEKIVRQVIFLMQELYPYVLLDLSKDLSAPTQMALENTDSLLLVANYSMAAAAGATQIEEALDSLGYPHNRILWVVNSVSDPAALTLRQLTRMMSSKPIARIPFDPETMNWAATEGMPLSEVNAHAISATSIHKLAMALCKSTGHAAEKSTMAEEPYDREILEMSMAT